MKKLLNTLYVTSENSYLGLDGENIVVFEEDKEKGRLPLHNLEGIVSFGYRGVSPALMGSCAEKNISLCFMTPQGKFLARITGKTRGNVLLREQQYASSLDSAISLEIAKNCILGKVYNARSRRRNQNAKIYYRRKNWYPVRTHRRLLLSLLDDRKRRTAYAHKIRKNEGKIFEGA